MKKNSSENVAKFSKIKIFCQISSIRGISKIHSAKTKFEKLLWSGFVLLMTCILIVTMVFLIQDYLQYTTAWHTSTILDYPSPFPAITICGQNPFSLAANDYWLKRSIMSPSELQDNLTMISLKALDTPGSEIVENLRLYDMFSTYYMNLEFSETVKLGHSKDMIRYCILLYKSDIVIAEKCDFTKEKFSIKLFSHAEYFNCFTIEGEEQNTTEVIGLILLVQLTSSEKIPELSNSFLFDILQRGEGLKLAIHEPKTYPDIENSGINMHPAKMNSLVYSPTKWLRLSTSKNPCRNNQKSFFDLYREYKYVFTQCVSAQVQSEIIDKCGCMLGNYPRPYPSNSSVPYCIKLVPLNETSIISKRLECVFNIKEQYVPIRQQIENKQCFPPCQFYVYDTTMSITRWTANEIKLKSLEKLYRSYLVYRDDKSQENVDRIKTILRQSLNLSQELREQIRNNKINQSSNFDKVDANAFTYISLMRKNFDIHIKTEKLVLDSNTLLSRIGGLTSICIGLTAAVFAEIVEFLYRIYQIPSTTRSKEANHVNQETFLESKQLIGFSVDQSNFGSKSKNKNNPSLPSPSLFIDVSEGFTQSSHPANLPEKTTAIPEDTEYWIYKR